MKACVYISSEKIEAVGYTGRGKAVRILKYAFAPLREGAVINGRITDSEELVEQLKALKAQHPALFKRPALMAEGGTTSTKRISVPKKLSRSRYLRLCADEFADIAAGGGYVYGCRELKSKSKTGRDLFICAAELAQINDYISAFAQAGVGLSAIRVGKEAVLEYVALNAALFGGITVINAVDGFTMLSMIFNSGVNVFISRTRLYGEGPEFLRSVADNLSGMSQFARSEQLGELERSCYIGLSAEDVEYLAEINPSAEILVEQLSPGGGESPLPAQSQFIHLGAMLSSAAIDLKKAIKNASRLKKQRKATRRRPLLAVLLLLLAAALATPTALLNIENAGLDTEIAELEAYVNGEENLAKIAELDALEAETARLNDILRQRGEVLGPAPSADGELLDFVGSRSGNVEIDRYSVDEAARRLSISGSSTSQSEVAGYVEALKLHARVQDISYTGYGQDGSGRYGFSLEITLMPNGEALP
jgi:hypothetical protein